MSMFGGKTGLQTIEGALSKCSADQAKLHAKAEKALSVFAQTAKDLDEVNAGYQAQIEQMGAIMDKLHGDASLLRDKMADNTAVKENIMRILGK